MTVLKVTMGDTRKILEAYFESSSPQFFSEISDIFLFLLLVNFQNIRSSHPEVVYKKDIQ